MRNVWQIARYEYTRHVRKRGFLFTAFGIPLLLAAIFAIIIVVIVWMERDEREDRLGLVDQTGRFAQVDVAALDLDAQPIPVEQFPDEQAARAAFDQERIDAYFVIPSDYLDTGDIRAVTRAALSDDARDQLRETLRAGLLANAPPEVQARLDEPLVLSQRALDGGREVGDNNVLLFFVPYLFAIIFFTVTFTSSGYLLQAITEEKEDRVMEILATTVSPVQMMAGKIVGLYGVGLTQMLVWLGMIGVGVLALAVNLDLGFLADLQLPWGILGLALLYFLLGYLLVSACYALAGAAVPTIQEAQPLVAPVSLLAVAPLMLLFVILSQPNSTLALVFSLIPFSAPITMLMRLVVTDVPPWQIAASLGLLALAVVGVVLLAARVMRRGMLRYGKRLPLAEIFGLR